MGGYRGYNEIGIYLLNKIINDELPVGASELISYREYIDYHMKLNSQRNPNPKNYANGPIKRELRNVQNFKARGVEFIQELVRFTEKKENYNAGETFFRLTRVK